MGESGDAEQVGPPPSQTTGEVVQAVARGAISAIPVFGGPAAELLGLVLQPAFDRRREEWLAQLGSALDDLQSRVDNFPEELSANEVFITTVMAATTAAFRTHEAEKVEALRNAIVSSGTSALQLSLAAS